MSERRLAYVADPMCSWCYGFAPVVADVEESLAEDVAVELVLGGLAPDDDAPMPAATRAYVQEAWRAVAERTGAVFEHAFWERCEPRRSTWPACRAVLAAGERGREMFAAIQSAYYREARDPSDRGTLVELGVELGFDAESFRAAIDGDATRGALAGHLERCARWGVRGFPSLVAIDGDGARLVSHGYEEAPSVLARLGSLELLRRR